MKSICVYCGSAAGVSPAYAAAARELAATLVAQDLHLIYGGGNVGLMGIVADEVMRLGGRVTGVIPQALMDKEVGHTGLTQLHVVNNMHERKALMAQLSDAFIALPGGIGTLEELFEVFTWAQLGFHNKPLGLLNVAGFYDGLLTFLSHAQTQGFLLSTHLDLLFAETEAAALLEKFSTYQAPTRHKWVTQRDL
ncbi:MULTISPECIES: TIGR00730 family Rossman fold protein [unclassified Undibacterium]|uniref:LOG family protein n=1 Tax=unclassified Undibacterium TaxID=2630295 RepID=UPI002AC9406E|nr:MULTISPECIES: TIGR00730 family Rossman fold protein [unclassified Undibacterium]MEB0140042.1 TIGR00730 family Rossman fold protein [Undibacterium sp. CCC2.1]MEB0173045.1 TIGR00730 family Rossman fold protein [Undibacterium sp. CCC1.1]MEB0176857.1 TIGR00730 family Rossman fold protein [Undibacterium sp. CCC3.4]MEB0216089.1 TIGR00730 family Rossman fold protein [Undibacterium sp. 5I2]WPX42027.1 TIGR00730 family Rossman fold protein [Undibacterium sp. CCC3.4]